MGKPDSQRAGADAVIALLRSVEADSNALIGAHWDAFGEEDGVDARDYEAVCQAIGDSIAANVTNAEALHREGYLRALADMVCMFVDGCTKTLDEWDPIEETAAAFSAARRSRAIIGRAAHG